jgi:hypothetical protein
MYIKTCFTDIGAWRNENKKYGISVQGKETAAEPIGKGPGLWG